MLQLSILSGLCLFIMTMQSFQVSGEDTCPNKCNCSMNGTVVRVNCANQGFTNIPDNLPNNAVELILDSNAIESLHANAFPTALPALTMLSLRNNSLASIDTEAFTLSNAPKNSAVPNLQNLDISDNLLPILPGLNCANTPNLASITVNNNILASFEVPQNLYGCSTLRRIFATGNNKVNAIMPTNFQYMNALGLIKLELGNNITTIDANAFTPIRRRLTSLTLKDNPIGMEAFGNLTNAINGSTSLAILTLSHLTGFKNTETLFSVLQKLVLQQLKTLDMSQNPMGNMTEPLLGMTSILEFFCDSCQIAMIADTVFQNLPKLKRLMLKQNFLTRIPENLPDSLSWLRLEDNNLGNLKETNFSSMPKLKELDLDKAGITALEPENFNLKDMQDFQLHGNFINESSLYSTQSIFKYMTNLELLDMSYEFIEKLSEPSIFQSLSLLKSLNVSRQFSNSNPELGLQYIHSDIFNGLTSLKTLDLSWNKGLGQNVFENDTEGRLFSKLWNLTSLSLAVTNLKNISEKFFIGLKSLNDLDLSVNTISTDTIESVVHPLPWSTLSSLNLANNSLSTVPVSTLELWKNAPNLKVIDLSFNPFQCNYDIIDFVTWLRNITHNFTDPETWPSDPSNKVIEKGPITMVNYKSYSCSGPSPCLNMALMKFEGHPELCLGSTQVASSPAMLPGGIGAGGIVLTVIGIIATVVIIVGAGLGAYYWTRKNGIFGLGRGGESGNLPLMANEEN